jgi:hypothetical protein
MRGFPWARFCLAELRELTTIPTSALLVFFEMVAASKPGGFVCRRPSQLVKSCSLSKGAVSKALLLLVERQFIERLDRDFYRVNPRYVKIGPKQSYTPKLPGLVDTSTGVLKRFKTEDKKPKVFIHE